MSYVIEYLSQTNSGFLDYPLIIICVLLVYIVCLLSLLMKHDKNQNRLNNIVIDGKTIQDSLIVCATSWVHKRVGLLNAATLQKGNGLYIEGSRKVHTVGMLFAIDIIFLDSTGQVTGVYASNPPGNRCIVGPSLTKNVLELAAGEAADLGIAVGCFIGLTSVETNTIVQTSAVIKQFS